MTLVTCEIAGRCSGCVWIGRPYEEQLEDKRMSLSLLWRQNGLPEETLTPFQIRTVAPCGLRDRADIIFSRAGGQERFGLYERDRREVIALGECPAMSPELYSWFCEFRNHPPPFVSAGSLRLRVSPDRKRGVWLDFSNTDIKSLLDEQNWLGKISTLAIVEIGQKRKRLIEEQGRLRLGEPVNDYWIPSFIHGKPVPLYNPVGTFTQPGALANQALLAGFEALLPEMAGDTWVELGSGNGNLTLPLLSRGANVMAIELDRLSLQGLSRSAKESGFETRLKIAPLSFQSANQNLLALFDGVTGIVADPPRSGLMDFPRVLEALPVHTRPRFFIYVSCFAESFTRDLARLLKLGYKIQELRGVDQFPQTPHCEFLARLSL